MQYITMDSMGAEKIVKKKIRVNNNRRPVKRDTCYRYLYNLLCYYIIVYYYCVETRQSVMMKTEKSIITVVIPRPPRVDRMQSVV